MRCVICNFFMSGHSNNADPVAPGRCCDDCNITKVIPARIQTLQTDKEEDMYEMKDAEVRIRKDTIVESVVGKFQQRSDVGIKKYNQTLDREDLSMEDWAIHLQEELMDATLYIEKLLTLIRKHGKI